MKLFYHPLLLIFLYVLLHLSIRLIFDNSIQVDDREQIIVAQEILLGYDMPQPPLYSWFAYFFFKIFGINLYALSILKYFLIFITFIFIHRISNLIFANKETASMAIFSYLLMVPFAWHMHQGFTHTIMLSLGIVMSTYYILKIIHGGNLWMYFMLGISLAIGILGKYSFIVYCVLMTLVLISDKEFRKKFLEYRSSVTLLTLFSLILPHFLWLVDNWRRIHAYAEARLEIESNTLSFIEVLNKLLIGGLGFLSPLILILIFINYDKIFNLKKSPKNISLNEILFRHFFLYLSFALILFTLFLDMKEVRVRWLHPILMIAPFWFFLIIDRHGGLSAKKNKIYFSLVISFTILIFAIRLAQNTIGPQLGYYGRLNIPINATLKSIPLSQKVSQIYTPDFNLGSHLFSIFKDKTIIIGNKIYGSEHLVENGKCLILFDNDGSADANKDQMEAKYGNFLEIKSNSSISNYRIYYKYLENNNC